MQLPWSGAVLFIVAGLCAQGAAPVRTADAGEFSVPVHEPIDGADGLWTAGPDYKAQFVDGSFTFFPWLGSAYEGNRPWTWRTASVEIGGQPLAHGPTATGHSDWRVEFRGADVLERYDVRPEGIEQSFVIHERPNVLGELRIIGTIETTLAGDLTLAATQQELSFRDVGGIELVHYGAAWAIDATGRRTAATTTFDGRQVCLSVDGAWLGSAAFPVVVDPLTSRRMRERDFAGFGRISALDLTNDNEDEAVIYTRQFSLTDHDAYVRLVSSDGSTSTPVFTALDPARDVRSVAACFVEDASDYVFALTQWDGALGAESLLVYFHPHNSLTLNGGTVRTVAFPTQSIRSVDLGGARAGDGTNALLVYERAPPGSPNSDVYGRLMRADSNTLAAGTLPLSPTSSGATRERHSPTVQQCMRSGDGYWVTAWTDRVLLSTDDYDIQSAKISSSASRLAITTLQIGSETGAGNALHPRIEPGPRSDEWLMLYLHSDGTGSLLGKRLYVRRVTWPDGGAPALGPHRLIDSVGGLSTLSDARLAFSGGSHWGLVHVRRTLTLSTLKVARLGYGGGVTESASAFGSNTVFPIAPAITFTEDRRRFEFAWGSSDSGGSERYGLYTQGLEFSPDANVVPYGFHGFVCGTGRSFTTLPPYAGTRSFPFSLDADEAPNQPAVLMLSAAPASIPLAGIGMGTCVLLLDLSPGVYLGSLGTTTSSSGGALRSLNLPDTPLFIGDLYAQWFYINPNAIHPLKVSATLGLKVQVR